ncbi:hypothetical protein F5Y08DRAFT_303944 [Xylaria arbuscula]|nr:hypothetical protein F5Y08DRAFT_303944 [Xylaria arbuscula]
MSCAICARLGVGGLVSRRKKSYRYVPCRLLVQHIDRMASPTRELHAYVLCAEGNKYAICLPICAAGTPCFTNIRAAEIGVGKARTSPLLASWLTMVSCFGTISIVHHLRVKRRGTQG